MHAHTRPAELRLAELVAALSLGIDLGFGQPMEHVLRQCLIALRLAEQVGLDEQSRADVYYTALLINVGCHSDAHEQAKWFGDDIVMKSRKYAPEFAGGVRTALAAMGSIGAGNPPLHRFRIGLEFLISGHRDVDHMIDSHAKLAQSLAQQLGLPQAVLDAVAASYERWNGQGWPRGLSGAAIPIAARIAQFAEFVEVAHRMGGTAAVNALARERGGKQFDPALAALFCDRSEQIFGRATTLTRLAAVALPAAGDDLDQVGGRGLARRRPSGPVYALAAAHAPISRNAGRGRAGSERARDPVRLAERASRPWA